MKTRILRKATFTSSLLSNSLELDNKDEYDIVGNMLKETEKQMKALANKRRLAILQYLKKSREAAVGDIAGEIKLSFTATSKHLGVLYAGGMVEKDQRGLMIFYSLARVLHSATKHVIATL